MMRCMALVSMMTMKSTNWRVKSLASSIFFSIFWISAAYDLSQCHELLGMHELTLKLKPFFHTSHIIFLIS